MWKLTLLRPYSVQLRSKFEGVDKVEVSRRLVDLVVVSVLLDAGAGDAWKYTEEGTGIVLSRSEGLGVSQTIVCYVFRPLSSVPVSNCSPS